MHRSTPLALAPLALAALLVATVADVARADEPGLAAARQEIAARPPSDDTEVVFVMASGTSRVLRPCKKRPCTIRWVMASAATPRSATDAAATAGASPASPAPSTPASSGAPPTSPPAPGTAPPPPASASPRAPTAADFDALVRSPPTAAFVADGVTQGLDATTIASDAAQILGQIVVDRASAAAVELVRSKIVDGLRCGGATRFPRTCAVVAALRLQDIAQRRRALFDALLTDAARIALDLAKSTGLAPHAPASGAKPKAAAARAPLGGDGRRAVGVTTITAASLAPPAIAANAATPPAPPAAATAAAAAASDATIDEPLRLLVTLLVPDVARVLDGRSTRAPNVAAQRIADGMIALVAAETENGNTSPTRWIHDDLSPGRKAIAVAALAFAACESQAAKPQGFELDRCPVQDFARAAAKTIGITDAAVLGRSQELALQILDAATLRSGDSGAWRERLARAADAVFTAVCLAVDTTATLDGCPATLDPPPGARPPIPALSLARYVVAAAIDGDATSVVAGAAAAMAMAEGDDPPRTRSLHLVAALLAYGATYADKADAAAASQRRTKLLDDLTSEMTDRTSREGDGIWSLGGSLRATGGARVSTTSRDTAVYGPIALPLGVGFQNVPRGDTGFLGRVGWHLELSAIDLGQYVSYEEGGKVRTPEIADALAPSAMLGLSWGKSFPVVFGATGGYAPQYQFHPGDAHRGAIQIGAALGVYVPLFDID